MKKIYKVILIFIMLITLTCFQVVNAQEEAPIINEEQPSELAQTFYDEVLPYVITFFVSFLGTGGATLILKVIFGKSLKLLGLSKEKLEKANEVVGRSNLINEELKLLVTNKIDEAIKETTFYQEQLTKAYERVDELSKELEETKNDLSKSYEVITEVLKIAFLNNPDLVKNGYAIKIAQVLGVDTNGK
jgi:hypothetical protein